MFGIEGIEIYFPKSYVDQSEYCKLVNYLETFKNAGKGKYTKGLGQLQLSFANASEDVNSMSSNR
jgi:3-hydroxy-3-methylglutaryl CoA synthase